MKCKNRFTDKLPFRITSKVLWALLGSALIIIGIFLDRWSTGIEKKIVMSVEACDKLDKRIIPIETLAPNMMKTLDRIERKLDKHLEK